MKDHIRENYFLVLKLIIALALVIYLIIYTNVLTGASNEVLLLSAFFIATITGCEFAKGRKKLIMLILEGISIILLVSIVDLHFTLLFVIFILDIITIQCSQIVYFLVAYFPIIFVDSNTIDYWFFLMTFIIIIYYQHFIIIMSYRNQLQEDEIHEQLLKKNMMLKESSYREEISKSLLAAENNILEEKSRLSQALHDKLGHSINGSVYQLEACKVLMEKEPRTSVNIMEAVINNLRNSMDEIREILRKERPDKHKLAMLQLQGLCEDCKGMGIDAKYTVTGKESDIPDKYLEIILDNAYEAVSNALKYSKCTIIEIKIIVMNQLIRCSIMDNGVGCKDIVDGMGVAGMRKRVRSVNGIIDFESEFGFTINILLPLELAK